MKSISCAVGQAVEQAVDIGLDVVAQLARPSPA
jgi:hypothetical protein